MEMLPSFKRTEHVWMYGIGLLCFARKRKTESATDVLEKLSCKTLFYRRAAQQFIFLSQFSQQLKDFHENKTFEYQMRKEDGRTSISVATEVWNTLTCHYGK